MSAVSLACLLLIACTSWSVKPTADQILLELSRRSGLPSKTLEPMLADCDADQQSMYFCAYRDCVAADLELDATIAKRSVEVPACNATLGSEVSSFRQSRQAVCAHIASEEYEGGSMEPTALALCVAERTQQMIERVKMEACARHNPAAVR